MADLISRAAAINVFMSKPPEYYHSSYIVGELNILPTVDAEPVRHGRWIKHEGGYWRAWKDAGCTQWFMFLIKPESILAGTPDRIEYADDYECSECGARGFSYATGLLMKAVKHCPSCGAKMDGGDDGGADD